MARHAVHHPAGQGGLATVPIGMAGRTGSEGRGALAAAHAVTGLAGNGLMASLQRIARRGVIETLPVDEGETARPVTRTAFRCQSALMRIGVTGRAFGERQ